MRRGTGTAVLDFTTMVIGPLRLFLSYAHADEAFASDLRAHLAPLRDEDVLVDWYDRELIPGSGWGTEIRTRLETSNLVVALVSSDFLASQYAQREELPRAFELHRQGRLALIPVIIRNCLWRTLPLAQLQVLPKDGMPVDSWSSRDDAFVSVVTGIESAARQLLSTDSGLINDWLTSRLLRRRVIKAVQHGLAERGMYSGPIDGTPGPLTERAVKAFQQKLGLKVDRKIGPEVIRHLLGDDE